MVTVTDTAIVDIVIMKAGRNYLVWERIHSRDCAGPWDILLHRQVGGGGGGGVFVGGGGGGVVVVGGGGG